ncbi:MAG: chitosanase [Euryarchaeota archaeon]|nr:chitosanase [Euryarchaeota archaeon]
MKNTVQVFTGSLKVAISVSLILLLASPCLADIKGAALQMTATHENSDTDLQWNYAENIKDGRGITFGCIGFCTGTYDGNILIHYYTTLNPNNSLAKYIPALDKIDTGSHNSAGGDGNPSVTGLDGFIDEVHNCNDPLFKQAQLYELDQMYWNPAQDVYTQLNGKYGITQAILYDIAVREGADGMKDLVVQTQASNSMDEIIFDKALLNKYDVVLNKEGLGDTDRTAGFKEVLGSGNYNLITPYTFTAYGDTFTIDGNIKVETNTAVNNPVTYANNQSSPYISNETDTATDWNSNGTINNTDSPCIVNDNDTITDWNSNGTIKGDVKSNNRFKHVSKNRNSTNFNTSSNYQAGYNAGYEAGYKNGYEQALKDIRNILSTLGLTR